MVFLLFDTHSLPPSRPLPGPLSPPPPFPHTTFPPRLSGLSGGKGGKVVEGVMGGEEGDGGGEGIARPHFTFFTTGA